METKQGLQITKEMIIDINTITPETTPELNKKLRQILDRHGFKLTYIFKSIEMPSRTFTYKLNGLKFTTEELKKIARVVNERPALKKL